MTIETQPRCLKQLPRKRARFWMPNEKSSSSSISKRFFWFSVSTEYASCSVSLGVSTYSRFEFGDLAVDAQLRALAGGDVQVGRVALDHLLEQDAKIDGGRRLRGCGHGEAAVNRPPNERSRHAGPARPDGRAPANEDERARPEEQADARCAVDHAVVSRMTCSSVVIPFMTFSQPSMRSVSIPSSTAASRDLGGADVLQDQLAQVAASST